LMLLAVTPCSCLTARWLALLVLGKNEHKQKRFSRPFANRGEKS
jgi:hypothetical protein